MAKTPPAKPLTLFIILAVFVGVIVFYEAQLRGLRSQVKSLQEAMETVKKLPSVPQQSQPAKEPEQAYYPPVINAANNNKNTIQSVFSDEQSASDTESGIDKIKTRYEELLVTYLFLKKCGKTDATDYQQIMSALQKDIVRLRAPIRLQYDILTAAKGSYEGLYSRSDCAPSAVASTALQYGAYIKSLAK